MAAVVKKEIAQIKLQIEGGKANPSPPVGPALGQHGVNIMDFCKAFNAKTEKEVGTIIPVVITVFQDKTFKFITKTPPASVLLKKSLNLQKGSKDPKKEKIATITKDKIMEIAKIKMTDMNAGSLEAACKTISGTARSMGIKVE